MDECLWVDGKEIIIQHGLDAMKFSGRQVHTKVVGTLILPSRGANHVKVTGDEAVMMRCGRKADRIIALSGWLTMQAQGRGSQQPMYGRYRFNKKLMRLMRCISRRDAGLVRTMDKDMQGTWMGRKRQLEPQIRIRKLRNRRKGRGQLGRVEVDDEWVSKLHKHLWGLQGIWRSLREHTVVLSKYGVHLPVWSWVPFQAGNGYCGSNFQGG